jgi:hypothetical protein
MLLIAVIASFVVWAADDAGAGPRKKPNQEKPAVNSPNLPNPFRGTVENVAPKNVVVVGEKGPTGSFAIQAGTRILRDGRPILAVQIFNGEPIQVNFTLTKSTGLMTANEIFVGNLPTPAPASTGDSSGGKKKKKK